MSEQMTKKKPRVPGVLWKLFKNRARTLAETILSLIPPPSSATLQCRCKGSHPCLGCCPDGDRRSFLIREDDPSDYSMLLNQCFVVVSDNAPSPTPFDPHSRWPQFQIVKVTIEMMSCEKTSTQNVICTGYNKMDRSSTNLAALTSAAWSLLLERVGDGLMVYLLKYTSIFLPVHRKEHNQVSGLPINDLGWKLLKHTSESKNQQPSLVQEVDSVSVTADSAESSMSCLGCKVKGSVTPCNPLHMKHCSKMSCQGDSITGVDYNETTQENGVVAVAQSGKRSISHARQRRHKRRKLSSMKMCDENCSLPEEKSDQMTKKKQRVPAVLWKQFQSRARTLAETILSLIPPPPLSSATVQCRCRGSQPCLGCCSDGDRMSFLIREDDPSDYSKLLNQCFVVVSDNAPSPTPFDPHSRWSQLQIVKVTIEMMSRDQPSTNNLICTGYNKAGSGIVLEALTSASWSLLLERVGDGLMVYLLKYSSIFIPLHAKKHHQVAGIPINDLSWELLEHISESKNQQPSSAGVDCNATAQENGVVAVIQSGKRSRPYAWQRRHKRKKLSSMKMCDANCSLPEEKTKSPCYCCSVWQTLHKVPRKTQISKQSMLYKLGHASSILPGKHILSSLRPNVAGANALFKEIFGLSDNIATHSTLCSHSNEICVIKTTCLYHSLHKLLKILIRRAIHCPRLKLLEKYIFIPSSDKKDLFCSKGQVVSFIWAASRSIIPQELLGSPSNRRILRKNISKFIRLRIYEKFSLHQCMHKLKTSNFPFLSDNHSLCNSSEFGEVKQRLLGRWIYWFFTCLVVPLIQSNFYVTESEHGRLDVFFYERSVWEKLMKSSVSCLEEKCYRLLDVKNVQKIVSSRRFGFSRVRFRPKPNGIRPLANLKSSSRLPQTSKDLIPVNIVLRDLHVALKDIQLKSPEKLGSSVFSYNDVHRKLRDFLIRVKSGLDGLPCVYMVVADVEKAYESIDQDKLLHVMKDVITDDHLLHQTHNVTISKGNMQICQYLNSSRQFRSHFGASSSHSILVDPGRSRTARKNDLLFNLQQHVKYNVLHIDKKFYLQNVGIPQGSILSSLLCSFYYGQMENSILVPFLDKVAKRVMSESSGGEYVDQNLLLRFIDDFLFISTSKEQALAFSSRLERGVREYNCNMNKEKFALSFDFDKTKQESNSVYIDEDGNRFLRWSGLFINCKTLEVQADYTRYLDGHIMSTLTVSWSGNLVGHLRGKLCNYLRPKCHAIFYDSKINSARVVRLNIYQAFLICAMKFHCYVCALSDICKLDSGSFMNIMDNSLRFMYKLMKKQVYSLVIDHSLRPILKVKRNEVEWLGLRAYLEVLKRKQGRYKELVSLLELKLKSVKVEKVSPALKYAVDKSNSSVLWKIKY